MQNYFSLIPILLISLILIPASGKAFGQNYQDLIRLTAENDPYLDLENTYDMLRFSLGYTNGSRICPSNNCIFEFEGTPQIWEFGGPSTYFFNGVLRVGTSDSSGEEINYKVYKTGVLLEIIETTEKAGTAFHKVKGTINFGELGEIYYEIYDGTLILGGGTVHLDINAQPSSLLGL